MDELISKLALAIEHMASSVECMANSINKLATKQEETRIDVKMDTPLIDFKKIENKLTGSKNTKEESKEELKEEPKEEPKKNGEKNTFTLDGIRSVCAELTRAGKREDVKKLLNKFDVDKLTALTEDKYADFMEGVSML